ncbi:MAG: hypothetical protein LBT56_07035 [Prevotellaceae bacterium]|jgi:hypothetical protein|nr:hypothetical protein [Prevotellaceae bacterium]
MKDKKIIIDDKKNPVRDSRSVEMTNATSTRQSVRTATNKSIGCKPTACNTKGGFFFLPSDANLRLAL